MLEILDNSSFATYHPIVNFIYFMIILIINMSSMNPILLMISLLGGFSYSVILKGTSMIKQNLLFIMPIILITTIVNPMFSHDGVTILFYMMGNAVTLEAFIYGFFMGVLLAGILLWFSCFQVIMTSDKIIYLFGRIAPAIALTISTAFRFIPLLKTRFECVTQGQKCMRRDLKEGSYIKRARQFAKEMSILIAWSLEAAIETSDSMEARGYGLKGRTSFTLFKFGKSDGKLLSIIAIMGGVSILGLLTRHLSFYFYPALIFPRINWLSIVSIILFTILIILPIGIDIGGELSWKQFRSKM